MIVKLINKVLNKFGYYKRDDLSDLESLLNTGIVEEVTIQELFQGTDCNKIITPLFLRRTR